MAEMRIDKIRDQRDALVAALREIIPERVVTNMVLTEQLERKYVVLSVEITWIKKVLKLISEGA